MVVKYVFFIHYIIIILLFQRVVDDHSWWSYLLQSALLQWSLGIHHHAWSALCNKQMNTKNETKYMAQGRRNTKSGHNKFHLVFPFLLSVLKYETEIFILTLRCFPLFFTRFHDLLTLARVTRLVSDFSYVWK